MKKLFYVLPGLCLFASGAAAEAIDSVSFNPARLGRYETLKVSDQLTTKGGIDANAVTVQSGGTVSVNNAGNYKFPATEVLGSVEMKSTDFKADTLNSRGTASFENKSSSAESMITTLNTSTADVRANILDLAKVSIPEGGSFVLGENNIPRPASVGLDNCSNLTWVERTTDDNYKYKVLAFGSCAGEQEEEQECVGECAGGPIWKDCTLQNGGEAWCYKYNWDEENCKYVRASDNPSWGVRCPALDGMAMASGTCSCEVKEDDSEWIWAKEGPAFNVYAGISSTPVMSLAGAGYPSLGTATGSYPRVNTSIARLKLSSWNDQAAGKCAVGTHEGKACDKVADVNGCFVFKEYSYYLPEFRNDPNGYREHFMANNGGTSFWNTLVQVSGGDTSSANTVINNLRLADTHQYSAQYMKCISNNN